MWFDALCPFEGPTGHGEQVHILVEVAQDEVSESLDSTEVSDEVIQVIWDRLLEHESELPEFTEHSVSQGATRPRHKLSTGDVRDELAGLGTPNRAIQSTGEIIEAR